MSSKEVTKTCGTVCFENIVFTLWNTSLANVPFELKITIKLSMLVPFAILLYNFVYFRRSFLMLTCVRVCVCANLMTMNGYWCALRMYIRKRMRRNVFRLLCSLCFCFYFHYIVYTAYRSVINSWIRKICALLFFHVCQLMILSSFHYLYCWRYYSFSNVATRFNFWGRYKLHSSIWL